jgi:hypothetical protein
MTESIGHAILLQVSDVVIRTINTPLFEVSTQDLSALSALLCEQHRRT